MAVAPKQAGSGHNVLIIDDDEVSRQVMRRVLENAGHKVFELDTAIGATRLILRESINAVVIDVNMPAMRGDKLVQLFRANPRFGQLALVLVSGLPESELSALGSAAQADAVVTKSQIQESLLTRLDEAVKAQGG